MNATPEVEAEAVMRVEAEAAAATKAEGARNFTPHRRWEQKQNDTL